MSRPDDAAECFRQAGMIHDAVTIYEEQKKFEVLGDLYRELDGEEEAMAAFQREVVRLLEEERDALSAARILETKLLTSDEALAVLQGGWERPTNIDSAIGCLREEFALLERLGRPDAADSRLGVVASDPIVSRVTPLVGLLSDLSISYFNPSTRELAKDRARVVAGENLKGFSTFEQRKLLAAIQRTEEHDLSLKRDARRSIDLR